MVASVPPRAGGSGCEASRAVGLAARRARGRDLGVLAGRWSARPGRRRRQGVDPAVVEAVVAEAGEEVVLAPAPLVESLAARG